jgi:hypothetical protein
MQTQTIAITGRRHGLNTMRAKAHTVQQVPVLRACAICMHSAGEQLASELACHNAEVAAIHRPGAPCRIARAQAGACGPDARHMDMHSWQLHRRATS